MLERAYKGLLAEAALIPDESSRRSFLQNIPWHRRILALWEQKAAEPETTGLGFQRDGGLACQARTEPFA